jgi:hypothetical protein
MESLTWVGPHPGPGHNCSGSRGPERGTERAHATGTMTTLGRAFGIVLTLGLMAVLAVGLYTMLKVHRVRRQLASRSW